MLPLLLLLLLLLLQVVELQSALETSGIPSAAASWLITAGLTLEFSVLVAGG
jgi:hypothetical protein